MEETHKSKHTNSNNNKTWKAMGLCAKGLGYSHNHGNKKKQGPDTGRNLPWDTQQVQIVGTGVLLSEQDGSEEA